MLEFLTLSSSNSFYFFAPALFLIVICFISRVYFINSLDVNDPTSQYFYALKAFLSPSICPLIQSRNSLLGRNHYPLSFYWHCGRLAKLILYLFRKNEYSFSDISPEFQPYINLSFRIVLLSSQLFFPLLTQCLICFLFFDFAHPTLLSSFSCTLLVLQVNALFPSLRYPINTRSFGLFLFYLFFFIVINLLDFSFLDISQLTTDFQPSIASFPLLIAISFIYYFILQSSQQAAYVVFALTIGTSLAYVDLGIALWIVFSSTFFLMLQLNYTNIFPAIRAHFYHRIHMYSWAKKTYGSQRYSLKPISLPSLLSAFANFKYFEEGFDESLSKSNWLFPVFIYRIYPYTFLAVFLLLINDIISIDHFIVVVCISSFVSALLTLSQTFQGYGPPSLPIVIFLPLITMFALASLPVLFELPYGNVLALVIVVDLFIQFAFGVFYLFRRLVSCVSIARSTPMGIISPSFRLSASPSFAGVLQAFDFLVLSNFTNPLMIASLGIHYQSLIEASELYRCALFDFGHPKVKLSSNGFPITPAWRAIDNISYGWRMDQIAFDLSPQAFARIKPDFVILNPSRYNWLLSSLKGKSIKRSDVLFSNSQALIVKASSVLNPG